MKMLENDDKKVSLSPGSNLRPLDVIKHNKKKVDVSSVNNARDTSEESEIKCLQITALSGKILSALDWQ